MTRRYSKSISPRRKRLAFGSRHAKFAPESIDVFLVIADTRILHEMEPDSRVCPIGTNHEIERNLYLWPPAAVGF